MKGSKYRVLNTNSVNLDQAVLSGLGLSKNQMSWYLSLGIFLHIFAHRVIGIRTEYIAVQCNVLSYLP